MFNLTEDISTLTTIPIWQLEKLIQLAKKDICQCLVETLQDGQTVFKIDLGIGELVLGRTEDTLSYKFIPDKQLESMLLDTLDKGTSPLQGDLEVSNNLRMLRIYKELL